MTARKLHTVAGLALLLPFLAWIVTAMIFYIKPGYEGAYEFLQPRTYPISAGLSVPADSSWREIRCLRTILGEHLLVRSTGGWMQLDRATRSPRPSATPEEFRTLVSDAISQNPARYGQVSTISGDTAITTTGIVITLDWSRLSLSQRGPDTDRIDLLYRIHYLQWTGIRALDKILGPLGLALVFALSLLGVRLALQQRRRSPP